MKIMALGTAIILTLAALEVEPAQAQTLEATRTPYVWPSPTMSTPYPTVALPHLGAPPACAPYEDDNGPLLKGDPLLDWSPWASGLGWFGALEVDPVGPSVKNRLFAQVNVGDVLVNQVQLPSADLHWTAMPRVELGYRLGQAYGEFLISYRGLNSSGSGTLPNFDAAGNPAALKSRLSLNVIDFDYASREHSLGPLWDMKWRAGIRVANVYFDSSADTDLVSQHETNNFWGAGPHFALDLKRRLGDTGFSVGGQVDGGGVLGKIKQSYTEVDAGIGSGSIRVNQNEPAPVLTIRLGLDWSPPELPNLRLSTGYLFERWWTVGETGGRQGEVTLQGVFLRGEWRY